MSNGVKNPITGLRYNFRVERDFETWYENHKSLLNQIGIPALPCYVYKKNWADIGGDITTLFIAQSSSEHNIFEEENEIRKFYNNPERKITEAKATISESKAKISEAEAKISKPKTKVINWVNYFEERIKVQLPGNAKITKSFFKERDNNNLGNLMRFVIETNRKKEGIVDCYENGTVSIDVYDFSKHDQIFICYSVPSEIQKTIQGFNSLIELMK